MLRIKLPFSLQFLTFGGFFALRLINEYGYLRAVVRNPVFTACSELQTNLWVLHHSCSACAPRRTAVHLLNTGQRPILRVCEGQGHGFGPLPQAEAKMYSLPPQHRSWLAAELLFWPFSPLPYTSSAARSQTDCETTFASSLWPRHPARLGHCNEPTHSCSHQTSLSQFVSA